MQYCIESTRRKYVKGPGFLSFARKYKICDKKWIEVNDLSSGQYSDSKNIRFTTSVLRSDLCDYSDANIVVNRRIGVTGTGNANRRRKTNF